MMKKSIYLDYAAAFPMSDEVRRAMEPYFSEHFYNPSATYLAARKTRRDLEDFRDKIASTLGAKPAEIIFTAGATEANNLSIQGLMRQFPDCEILTSAIEHESVLEPARLFKHAEISTDDKGIVILNPSTSSGQASLAGLISDKTVLVSIMLVNNELGTIQPLREIAMMLERVKRERRASGSTWPLYLHTDAAQAGNYLGLHVSRLGVDMMSINGGKIYGPKQSGALYVKAGITLQPLVVGGGQEFGLRSGTENTTAAAGLTLALELADRERHVRSQKVMELREKFESSLLRQLPDASINGSKKSRAPHIISVTFPGADNERLMMELDERGIQCAVGSACSASRDEASHVLSAIGLSQAEARSTLRFSLGVHTTSAEIEKTLQALVSLTG